jgi:group I intron endonuclease
MAKIGIYAIRNKLNNKYYIGQSIDISRRIRDHKLDLRKNRHYNIHLQRSWNKYGKDAFEFKIIEVVNDADILDDKEIGYISFYNSFEGGYNQSLGGAGLRGRIYTEEEKMDSCRVKAVIQFDGDGNMINKYYSATYASRMTGVNKNGIMKNCQRNNNKAFSAGGYVWMYEEDFNIYGFDYEFYSNYNIKECFKEIVMVDLKDNSTTVFKDCKEAVEKTGVNKRLIESLCDESKKSHKTTNGYIFCYKDHYDKVGLDVLLRERKKESRGRSVVQIDKETLECINVFDSANKAGIALKVNPSHILCCAKGRRKTCGGFKWEFHNEGRGDLGGETIKDIQN